MIYRFLLAVCFCTSLLPFNAFCEADVVDDNENIAILDEPQATYASPVSDEHALAKDDSLSNKNNDNMTLLDKIRGLQQEVQELRGQLELQAHELKLLQEQELSFYKDLDARLRGEPNNDIKRGPTTATQPPETPTTPAMPSAAPIIQATPTPVIQSAADKTTQNPADEQIEYLAAYELVNKKQFKKASLAMQAFVNKHPHSGYSANAQYWLGELYLVQKDYEHAIEHFNVVLQEFPSSSKCAASLLKLGYAQAYAGKTAEARITLQKVITTYPDTSTARLATKKLNSL